MNLCSLFKKGCKIGSGNRIHKPNFIGSTVPIGTGCKIQAFAFIPDGVVIEDNVFIGPHTCFTNDKYPPSDKKAWRQTIVKKGASIGANVTVICGVVIGEGAKIGAGAVVTKDVPAGETWVGNPAHKLIKNGG